MYLRRIVLICTLILSSVLGYAFNTASWDSAFNVRKKLLVDYNASWPGGKPGFTCGSSGDFGKHVYPRIIAVLSKNVNDTVANSRLTWYANNCPTFHFNLVGLPRILYLYPNAPALTPATTKKFLDQVWTRTDGYNAFTGEGTENHLSMSRTSGYLYAQYALEKHAADFPDAATKLQQMKDYILYFSSRIYDGGTGEWNSSVYGVYNLEGYLNLYDFATDTVVKNAAKAVLDFYAAELALHYMQGVTSGAESRGAPSRSIQNDTDYLNWLWFGDSPRNPGSSSFWSASSASQAVQAAFSTYRPPYAACWLADKRNITQPLEVKYSRPSYLLDSVGYIPEYFYADRNFTMGSAYIPYGGWAGGESAMVSWKLAARVDSSATGTAILVTGGGNHNSNSSRKPNSLQGRWRLPFDQLVQHKNVVVQMTYTDATASTVRSTIQTLYTNWTSQWQTDFSQRFPGDNKPNPVNFSASSLNFNINESFLSYHTAISDGTESGIFFIQFPKVYLAVRTIGAATPTTPLSVSSSGISYQYIRDVGTIGNLCGMVIEAHNAADFASFADFKTQVKANTYFDKSHVASQKTVVYKGLNGDTIRATYNPNGTFTAPIFDWGYGPTTKQVIHKSPPFIQPNWPTGFLHGRIANYSVNGTPVSLANWPVYDSKFINLKNRVLRLTDSAGTCYAVDYSGATPKFYNTCQITSLKAKSAQTNLKVYPNPTDGVLTLESETDLQTLTVYGLNGTKVAHYQISGKKPVIDLPKLSAGIYMLQVIDAENKITHHKLMIR